MKILPILSYKNNFAAENNLTTNNCMSITRQTCNDVNILSDNASFKGNEDTELILFDGKKFSELFDGKAKAMFNRLGIEITDASDGLLTISRYGSKAKKWFGAWKPKDFKINENELFKYIKEIKGDADFRCSQITSLGNLESIGGDAYFNYSKVTSLGNLKNIGGDADFTDSQITTLNNLESIGGNTDFTDSQIISLGNLVNIGGNAYFNYSQITSLGNLKNIGGDVNFNDSQICSLGNLENIEGVVFINDLSPLKKELYIKKFNIE